MQVNPADSYNQVPRAERFGGLQPFEHHSSDINQYFGEEFKDDYDQQNMFFVQRRNKSTFRMSPTKDRKDPDVWEPPTPTRENRHKV
jgi:hypothetical protein